MNKKLIFVFIFIIYLEYVYSNTFKIGNNDIIRDENSIINNKTFEFVFANKYKSEK